MPENIESALDDLLQAAKIEHICGSQQLVEKRRQFLSLLTGNAIEWRDAYAAFQGAFDTPLARRRDDSEYAQDARKRLRAFNESMTAAHGKGKGAASIERA